MSKNKKELTSSQKIEIMFITILFIVINIIGCLALTAMLKMINIATELDAISHSVQETLQNAEESQMGSWASHNEVYKEACEAREKIYNSPDSWISYISTQEDLVQLMWFFALAALSGGYIYLIYCRIRYTKKEIKRRLRRKRQLRLRRRSRQ